MASKFTRRAVYHCVTALKARCSQALEYCDRLEALADVLPNRQIRAWRDAQRHGPAVLQPHFRSVTQLVLPVLILRTQDEGETQNLLLRLQSDSITGLETSLQLDDFFVDALLSTRFDEEPEALGFALRGFFQSFRKDLSWHMDVLWPLAERALSDEDAAQISVALLSA